MPKGRRICRVPWTEDEDNILQEYYPKEGGLVCHRLPGRTRNACKNRAQYYACNGKKIINSPAGQKKRMLFSRNTILRKERLYIFAFPAEQPPLASVVQSA